MRMYMRQRLPGEDVLLEAYPQIIPIIGAALAWWLQSLIRTNHRGKGLFFLTDLSDSNGFVTY